MLVDRLSWAATAATVAVMFFALTRLPPMPQAMQPAHGLAAAVAGAVASAGLYRLLSSGFLWLFSRTRWLRKMLLGKGFLEGTWIGHYTSGGAHFITVEHIDQASGQPRINGREFDANGKTRASWASDTVSVDTDRMRLVYAYTCTVFDRKHVQEGLGVFTMVRESAEAGPTKLDGYAVDLIDGDRDPNTEFRISEKPMPDAEAIAHAKKQFGLQ